MLAEDIGPWLTATALLFGGLSASVLALGALFPASRGNRPFTIGLITPAIIMVILTTDWLAQAYLNNGGQNQEEIIENYVQPWFFMGFPPLATSLVACFVLWFKRRKRTDVKYYTVAEAQRILHHPELLHGAEQVTAAHSLMHACEHDPQVTIEDMLRCLDYGGTIATVGARCLYVRTGRDGLGWSTGGSNGLPYITDRADWEAFLREHYQNPAG